MNIQDNYLEDELTGSRPTQPTRTRLRGSHVTTAANGADSAAGQGSSQIRMVTRLGEQQLHRERATLLLTDKLNANTWVNNRD